MMSAFRSFFVGALLFSVVALGSARAQAPEALAKFSVSELENKASIEWTMHQGYSCPGVVLEHSVDGVHFRTIFRYPGACGSAETSESYRFVHESPVQDKTNYYRLNLLQEGMSDTESVRFYGLGREDYVICPMPVTDAPSVLCFRNPQRTSFTLTVYDMQGRQVYARAGILENKVGLQEARLSTGTYLFRLTDGSRHIAGKLVKE